MGGRRYHNGRYRKGSETDEKRGQGLYNITAEMLQNTGLYAVSWLHRVRTAVWNTEKTSRMKYQRLGTVTISLPMPFV